MTNPSDGPVVKLPVKPLINPLTEQDRIAIEHVLDRLPHIKDLLLRAHECGLDVADRMAKHEMHEVIATKLKEHFFPTQLPLADH